MTTYMLALPVLKSVFRKYQMCNHLLVKKNQGNVKKSIYALFFSHILKLSVQLCIHTSSWGEHKRQRGHNTRGCALKLYRIFIHLRRAVLSQGLALICDRVKSWPAEVNKSFAIDISGLEFLLLSLDTWIAAWTSAEVVSKKSKCIFLEILRSAGEDNSILLKRLTN